ncbi:hypothetical protein J5X98_16705 [Leptothermofonsia sichuanensis E412]|uniref:hypothetical protein n=1 Tax=Leptothermofonsia sichuanensis TaxID=2917832 RepID=UPI001CA6B02D|nr:hypothetical protein [Leptothermofonsia sichuanensis]QZZ19054.1 hypothetical protein J5X98_16705 [Leptothermofonsia sichuanensis E412]
MEPTLRLSKPGRNIQQSQETIYSFLLEVVKKWPPEEVLLEFKRLFIYHVDSVSSDAIQSLYEIVFSNNEEEFRNTLKRSCYILINNWDASRNYKPIQELVKAFSDTTLNRYTSSPTLKRLRQWVDNFVKGKDFEELKLFASRYEDHERGPWSSRYTSYLLVPQYIDLSNPIEQREAARALSKQLKDRFKFDLAMYIARAQTSAPAKQTPKNPTVLGDEVLRLIKAIVARRGPFSYTNLANIFMNQIKNLTYGEFKQSLRQYLIFSVENREFVESLQAKLSERLDTLYESHENDIITNALILRTCNRVIEYLTTENQSEPSQLFILLLSQASPVTLVIVLLKIILICKHARTHLESCIAHLIKYYQDYPEEECTWVVNFLEVFNVTFAIHAENVQYNLIKMEVDGLQPAPMFDPDKYRIFSQLRNEPPFELFPEIIDPEQLLPMDDQTL